MYVGVVVQCGGDALCVVAVLLHVAMGAWLDMQGVAV